MHGEGRIQRVWARGGGAWPRYSAARGAAAEKEGGTCVETGMRGGADVYKSAQRTWCSRETKLALQVRDAEIGLSYGRKHRDTLDYDGKALGDLPRIAAKETWGRAPAATQIPVPR